MASLRLERVLWARGMTRVAGVDEAGRGPLAGPVVAAAVVLTPGVDLPGVDDSKKLTPARREVAYGRIIDQAAAWAVVAIQPAEIDRVNIRNASLLAMRRALEQLPRRWRPQFLLVDGNAPVPGLSVRQRAVVGGDRKSLTIAAASIIAKVTRDRMAADWDRLYPQYGFAQHKGYATAAHLRALERWGPCPLHRRSFLGGRQVRLPL